MKAFAALYDALDQTTSTNEKVAAMVAYFTQAPPADAAWALFFLTGRRFKRFISSRMLIEWFLEATGTPPWLFSEAYVAVGDTAETIALFLDTLPDGFRGQDGAEEPEASLAEWLENRILPLAKEPEEVQKAALLRWWATLDRRETYMLNKLLSGAFRVGVSQTLVLRALAEVAGQPAPAIAHRLMGHWEPTAEFFQAVVAEEHHSDDDSRPYPFYLAYQLDQDPESLGDVRDWQVEWKWDGIRAQLIKRNGQVFLWSRGEDLVTERFPEIAEAARALPDGTVLDGEILAWSGDNPLPFSVLQTRIGRKVLGKKVLAEAPVAFMAYDLLELGGKDIRSEPLHRRRLELMLLLHPLPEPADRVFRLSEALLPDTWQDVAALRRESRERGVEGFVLKRLDSPYQTGRKKGDWWKWKVDPYTVDAVLIYAQAGHGRRANLFTDYTFAVWHDGKLVPVAKAYSGLSNQEIERLDRWIRAHTVDKFGPVRSVEPYHVFELAFEGIAASPRHKSGVALRFPRIARWRDDKTIHDADTLDRLRGLIYAR